MKKLLFLPLVLFQVYVLHGQDRDIPVLDHVPLQVNFDVHLQDWDGFGFNYVETAQTTDYAEWPQDYGGFSLLSKKEKKEITELVFGEDGLKVGLVKMFLDPFHQETPGGPFDHETTTANMREFVKAGYKATRARGGDLQIITTMYGPPAWATLQKYLRGRDLDPEMKDDLARYMVDWARFLKEEEELPLRYISLHNEGEDWNRWPRDGQDAFIGEGHDYNLWWPTGQMLEFVKLMPGVISEFGLDDVYVTNGECSNWFRFSHWGDAWGLHDDPEAAESLGLITSHGFYSGNYNYWYGDHNPLGINLVKEVRPGIHAWTTSSSWANMDVDFVRQIYGSIYSAGINGYIPWAGIQRPPMWVGGDPNPGNAIQVSEDGDYEVRAGFYFYKQVTRAGQPGMKVARTITRDSELTVIAFASNGTGNPDAFVVLNTRRQGDSRGTFSNEGDKHTEIIVTGTPSKKFRAYRTNGTDEMYSYIGEFELKDGRISYVAPRGSVTTFFAID